MATEPTSIGWTVEGPGRDFDYSVFPDTDEGAKAALQCAKDWLEECWDAMERGGEAAIVVKFGAVIPEDLEDTDA